MSDTSYLNQINQLVDLQKVDDEIFAVKQGLDKAPKELGKLQETFAGVNSRRNHVLDKLEHLEEQKKRLSNEIEEDSNRIKKSKNKMMQVGNEREHQAIVREMDTLERSSRAREEERLTLLDEIQIASEQLGDIENEYNALKAELDEKTASLESAEAEAEDRLQVLNRKRDHASENIPRPVFLRYEFIRERLEHPVIVPVRNGICTGCNIAIPPQTYIDLQRGQQIWSCPNCQRLIFWDEHYDAPVTMPQVHRNKDFEVEDEERETSDIPWDNDQDGQEEQD